MKHVLIPTVALSLIALTFALAQDAKPSSGAVTHAVIGSPAPAFELKDVYGKTFTLGEFKEKIVVLEWLNQDCPVSHGKHKDGTMQKTYKKFAAKDVMWLAIDSTYNQKPDKNRVYAADEGLAYPILMDADGKVGHLYGARTTPHMFVVDKKGVLVYDGAIDDHKETNYVTAAIEALLAGKPVEHAKTTPYGCSVKYKS